MAEVTVTASKLVRADGSVYRAFIVGLPLLLEKIKKSAAFSQYPVEIERDEKRARDSRLKLIAEIPQGVSVDAWRDMIETKALEVLNAKSNKETKVKDVAPNKDVHVQKLDKHTGEYMLIVAENGNEVARSTKKFPNIAIVHSKPKKAKDKLDKVLDRVGERTKAAAKVAKSNAKTKTSADKGRSVKVDSTTHVQAKNSTSGKYVLIDAKTGERFQESEKRFENIVVIPWGRINDKSVRRMALVRTSPDDNAFIREDSPVENEPAKADRLYIDNVDLLVERIHHALRLPTITWSDEDQKHSVAPTVGKLRKTILDNLKAE